MEHSIGPPLSSPSIAPVSPSIRALLTDSLTAHNEARALRRVKPRPTAAIWAELNRAYHLRMAAHDHDPEHADPAWQDEQTVTIPEWDTHATMLAFYEQQLLLNA